MPKEAKRVIGGALLFSLFLFGLLALSQFLAFYERVGAWALLALGSALVFVVGTIGYLVFKYPAFKAVLTGITGVFGDLIGSADQKVSNKIKQERRAVPRWLQRELLNRANNRCEFPRCSYTGALHIHHTDENPNNSNDAGNLVVICPNHHAECHQGNYNLELQRSWIQASTQRSKQRVVRRQSDADVPRQTRRRRR